MVVMEPDDRFSFCPCSRTGAVIHEKWPYRTVSDKGMLGVGVFYLGVSPQARADDNGKALSLPGFLFLFTKVVSEVKSLDSKPINPHL